MEIISDTVIYIMMAFVLIGAVAAIRDDQGGIGKEFMQGLHSIGYLFIPVAGVMASLPYLSIFVEKVLGPIWSALGADPSMAATTFIASDMGGYQLAEATAQSDGAWITAMVTGYMAGATIVFTIPVGLAMLQKADHKYMALGIMSGILTIPIGVAVTMLIVLATGADIRSESSTTGPADTPISGLDVGALVGNLVPLVIVVLLIATGLKFLPDLMIKLFMAFGRFIDAAVKIILALSIVEYFTGVFSRVFGSWGFDAIIATEDNTFRALEVAGYVGIMLAGAFPMVYAIQKYMSRPLNAVGSKFGISQPGMAGILDQGDAREGQGTCDGLRHDGGIPSRRSPVVHSELSTESDCSGPDRQADGCPSRHGAGLQNRCANRPTPGGSGPRAWPRLKSPSCGAWRNRDRDAGV